ncbi:unnamed protein product [Durusdinium trenchii]|uniref:RING-type domain-containing protein n=2 Tax=Durusdinium trenchii TaxID=1381693 RepID=A0ABP0KC36_9DINO
MAQRSVPLKAAGVIADGARGEVWRAVALQAHLLGKPPRPVRTRSSSAGARQESQVHSGLSQPSRSAPSASGFRHAELDYDEKIRRHQASLSLAQRMGLVAEPAQPLTSMQWEVVKHRSDTREDSEVPCSICLEDFRMRPQVILSCSHVFHGECLRSFERFAGKRQCPLCRCPYFDATIHHSGLMVWRKKCASRIQRAWRGYLSRKELFNELRLPSVRKEAPTLHRRFCGKALQVLGGKLEKACEDHEDALDKFLEELDGSVAKSSAAIRDGLCGFEQLHGGIQPPPDGSQAEVISAVKGTEQWSWSSARRAARCRGEEVDCPICFQPCHLADRQSDRVELLSCTHVFHRCCIMSFESFHVFEVHLCPVCRQHYERRPWNSEAKPVKSCPPECKGGAKAQPRPPRLNYRVLRG